jgi:hypothetical protein
MRRTHRQKTDPPFQATVRPAPPYHPVSPDAFGCVGANETLFSNRKASGRPHKNSIRSNSEEQGLMARGNRLLFTTLLLDSLTRKNKIVIKRALILSFLHRLRASRQRPPACKGCPLRLWSGALSLKLQSCLAPYGLFCYQKGQGPHA